MSENIPSLVVAGAVSKGNEVGQVQNEQALSLYLSIVSYEFTINFNFTHIMILISISSEISIWMTYILPCLGTSGSTNELLCHCKGFPSFLKPWILPNGIKRVAIDSVFSFICRSGSLESMFSASAYSARVSFILCEWHSRETALSTQEDCNWVQYILGILEASFV